MAKSHNSAAKMTQKAAKIKRRSLIFSCRQ
jgi:hypothetical protein